MGNNDANYQSPPSPGLYFDGKQDKVLKVNEDGMQVSKTVGHYTMISQPDGEQIGFCVSEHGTGKCVDHWTRMASNALLDIQMCRLCVSRRNRMGIIRCTLSFVGVYGCWTAKYNSV